MLKSRAINYRNRCLKTLNLKTNINQPSEKPTENSKGLKIQTYHINWQTKRNKGQKIVKPKDKTYIWTEKPNCMRGKGLKTQMNQAAEKPS